MADARRNLDNNDNAKKASFSVLQKPQLKEEFENGEEPEDFSTSSTPVPVLSLEGKKKNIENLLETVSAQFKELEPIQNSPVYCDFLNNYLAEIQSLIDDAKNAVAGVKSSGFSLSSLNPFNYASTSTVPVDISDTEYQRYMINLKNIFFVYGFILKTNIYETNLEEMKPLNSNLKILKKILAYTLEAKSEFDLDQNTVSQIRETNNFAIALYAVSGFYEQLSEHFYQDDYNHFSGAQDLCRKVDEKLNVVIEKDFFDKTDTQSFIDKQVKGLQLIFSSKGLLDEVKKVKQLYKELKLNDPLFAANKSEEDETWLNDCLSNLDQLPKDIDSLETDSISSVEERCKINIKIHSFNDGFINKKLEIQIRIDNLKKEQKEKEERAKKQEENEKELAKVKENLKLLLEALIESLKLEKNNLGKYLNELPDNYASLFSEGKNISDLYTKVFADATNGPMFSLLSSNKCILKQLEEHFLLITTADKVDVEKINEQITSLKLSCAENLRLINMCKASIDKQLVIYNHFKLLNLKLTEVQQQLIQFQTDLKNMSVVHERIQKSDNYKKLYSINGSSSLEKSCQDMKLVFCLEKPDDFNNFEKSAPDLLRKITDARSIFDTCKASIEREVANQKAQEQAEIEKVKRENLERKRQEEERQRAVKAQEELAKRLEAESKRLADLQTQLSAAQKKSVSPVHEMEAELTKHVHFESNKLLKVSSDQYVFNRTAIHDIITIISSTDVSDKQAILFTLNELQKTTIPGYADLTASAFAIASCHDWKQLAGMKQEQKLSVVTHPVECVASSAVLIPEDKIKQLSEKCKIAEESMKKLNEVSRFHDTTQSKKQEINNIIIQKNNEIIPAITQQEKVMQKIRNQLEQQKLNLEKEKLVLVKRKDSALSGTIDALHRKLQKTQQKEMQYKNEINTQVKLFCEDESQALEKTVTSEMELKKQKYQDSLSPLERMTGKLSQQKLFKKVVKPSEKKSRYDKEKEKVEMLREKYNTFSTQFKSKITESLLFLSTGDGRAIFQLNDLKEEIKAILQAIYSEFCFGLTETGLASTGLTNTSSSSAITGPISISSAMIVEEDIAALANALEAMTKGIDIVIENFKKLANNKREQDKLNQDIADHSNGNKKLKTDDDIKGKYNPVIEPKQAQINVLDRVVKQVNFCFPHLPSFLCEGVSTTAVNSNDASSSSSRASSVYSNGAYEQNGHFALPSNSCSSTSTPSSTVTLQTSSPRKS